ncbi:ABC transporter permease [uncultured Bacteroides sp.]|uniref:ABC transporter permease n=1 Tax=uncultured Bacteroides sp. TaxID=162156 RepID=UPI0025EBC9DB|nr:ABC transporter permease [uncultured Bacteroides sp.]
MLKLILKNLWARRRRNGWLLAELVLVSIISWVVLDPVIVVTHDRNIPLGYDADRLCLVSLGALQPNAQGYDPAAQDSAVLLDSYFNLVRHAADFEGVEATAPVLGFCYPNSPQGNSNTQLIAEGDSVKVTIMQMYFMPHTRFFEAYGFKEGEGRTLRQLSDLNYGPNDIVLTENAAERLFHTGNAVGRRCHTSGRGSDTTFYQVAGTIGTIKAYSFWRPVPVVFRPISSPREYLPDDARILIRLKEGVSMQRFLHEFRPWMVKELRRGNLFARTVLSYEKLIEEHENYESTPIYRRNLAMALFFLINLCLGVAGTFWLQTRTRREEIGVMLSFGATPGHIVRLLMGEGAVLTFIASLTGFLIYLQYALKEGLSMSMSLCWMENTDNYWVSDFTLHFLIVSCIILLILLLVVLAGIYIPARSISRIPPTEALRDE